MTLNFRQLTAIWIAIAVALAGVISVWVYLIVFYAPSSHDVLGAVCAAQPGGHAEFHDGVGTCAIPERTQIVGTPQQ